MRWPQASMSRVPFHAGLLLSFLLAMVSSSQATSIVILRSPHGTKIVVAADSEFSLDSGAPVSGCKIVQIGKKYWTAISGLASQPETHFDSYQIALDASANHPNSLDDIAAEVREKTLAGLPSALKRRQKMIGKEAFWREYKDGFDAHEEAFWGLEDGAVRLIYLQFSLHRGWFGALTVSSNLRKCPGNGCPDPGAGFGTFLGHHKIIEKFMEEHPDWPNKSAMETRARQFVQMEIESEPNCHCSAPIVVLSMDRFGTPNWVGQKSQFCRAPH